MLKKILSVSGKPGLYQMVSQGKNMLIIESLTDSGLCERQSHFAGRHCDLYERERSTALRSAEQCETERRRTESVNRTE